MKIFEFHFNPEAKPDFVFDSFCYEPSNTQEKKLGNLYVIGELKNTIPQNQRLINNLAQLLKREYYSGSFAEPALKRTLKKANEFLAEKTKLGNISWLGNLSMVVLSLDNLNLNFSKDGSIKILLLRPGQITDMGKPLEIEEFEPYPLKIFTNIVGGKFLENDKILILTKEVFDFFSNRDFLEKISFITDERGLRIFFKEKGDDLAQLNGICLLILLAKEGASKSELVFKKPALHLSLKEMFSPLSKILIRAKNNLPQVSLPRIRFQRPKLSLPRLEKPSLNFSIARLKLRKVKLGWQEEQTKKNLLLIFAFIVLLLGGFIVSRRESEVNLRRLQDQLVAVQEKVVKAEGYLVSNNEKKANSLFEEAFKAILPLTEEGSLGKDVLVLKTLIEKNLKKLNQVVEVANPKIVFDFEGKKFVPQRLMFFENDLYFLNPLENGLAKLKENNLEKIGANQGFNFVAVGSEGLFLFSKPNKIFTLKDNKIEETAVLKLSSNTVFGEMVFFKDSFYFLDKNNGQVIKYQQPLTKNKENPQQWILSSERTVAEPSSFAVDGSVYVLAEGNSLWRYYAGRLEKIIPLTFFPLPKNMTKIILSPLSYFIVLEPEQNRVVLINKSGGVIKQFQNENFSGLKDATFSADGKTLYLLSGLKVYQLDAAF
jgi:hypothetical protein